MPPSIFNGRPWPAPGEALWLEEDRDIAVALALIDAEACSGCGQPTSESMDPANEYAYRIDLVRCHACAATDREVSRFARANSSDGAPRDGVMAGLFTRVELKST